MLNALKNKFTPAAAALGLSAALAFGAVAEAQANDNITVNYAPANYYTSSLSAVSAATKYAQENDAIGVVIGFGDFEGATPPQVIGEKFKAALTRRDETSQYFIIKDKDVPGYSMSFAFGPTGTEFMTVDEAVAKIDEISNTKKRLRSLLSGSQKNELSLN